MAEPLRLDFVVRRNTPFAREWPFSDADGEPIDFTGATAELQVRLYGAQAGDPLVSLANVASALDEGLVLSGGSILPHIHQATLMTLPNGARGEPVQFAYDMTVTLPGRVAEIWQTGTMTVIHGVTDRLELLTDGAGALLVGLPNQYLIAG